MSFITNLLQEFIYCHYVYGSHVSEDQMPFMKIYLTTVIPVSRHM